VRSSLRLIPIWELSGQELPVDSGGLDCISQQSEVLCLSEKLGRQLTQLSHCADPPPASALSPLSPLHRSAQFRYAAASLQFVRMRDHFEKS